MEGYLKPIGGEFWFDLNMISSKIDNFKENDEGIYLDGGQSAIKFIIENMDVREDEYILLPSYLCLDIVNVFIENNIKIAFYDVNRKLEINAKSIMKNIENYNVKAVFFIDYFGFPHSEDTIRFFNNLKNRKIIIIEDAVQSLWFNPRNFFIGDYVFNSYRKFIPIDGSIVLTKYDIKAKYGKSDSSKYYELVNTARSCKMLFQEFHIGTEDNYLKLFDKAKKEYLNRKKSIFKIMPKSKKLLSNINIDNIKNIRIDNYRYVYNRLKNNGNIKIIFGENLLKDNIPLGFPILINNRDEIRKSLMMNSIYCPIHWNINRSFVPLSFKDSYYLSSHVLTLPIDQRYTSKDMERLVDNLLFYI